MRFTPYDGKDTVIVGHNCIACRDNYKCMAWRDKLFVADPFAKKES